VTLLYDVYHQQITEGNVIQTISGTRRGHRAHSRRRRPGRHEPGTGELNYANVFGAIDAAGYDGYVGCEFSPTGDPDEAMAGVLEIALTAHHRPAAFGIGVTVVSCLDTVRTEPGKHVARRSPHLLPLCQRVDLASTGGAFVCTRPVPEGE